MLHRTTNDKHCRCRVLPTPGEVVEVIIVLVKPAVEGMGQVLIMLSDRDIRHRGDRNGATVGSKKICCSGAASWVRVRLALLACLLSAACLFCCCSQSDGGGGHNDCVQHQA